jgi:hypothetical protein
MHRGVSAPPPPTSTASSFYAPSSIGGGGGGGHNGVGPPTYVPYGGPVPGGRERPVDEVIKIKKFFFNIIKLLVNKKKIP